MRLAGAALCAVALGSWWVLDWRGAPPPPGESAAGAGPAATAAAVAGPPPYDAGARESVAPVAVAGAPAPDEVPFAVVLRGLHPDAPWTERLHLKVQGRDDAADRWLAHDVSDVPAADGVLRASLPVWAWEHVREVRVYGDDPNYASIDVRRKAALPPSGELTIDVRVVAVLRGRVVDGTGAPVPAAGLAAYPASDGAPRDVVVGETTTDADGGYVLQVPPATDLYVLAAAMQEASLGGRRVIGRNGAIAVGDAFRPELLPAGLAARGAVGRPQTLPDLVLPPSAVLTGFVRWSDGRPVAQAEVELIPLGEPVLQFGDRAALHRLGAGAWAPRVNVTTGDRGEFRTPFVADGSLACQVPRIAGHALVGFVGTVGGATAGVVDVQVPRPVRLRVVDHGRVVPGATVRLGQESCRADDRGELCVVVGARLGDAGTLTARAEAGALCSPVVPLDAGMAGATIELPMQPQRVALAIEFDGPFRVRNARFELQRLGFGLRITERLVRDDAAGAFTVWCEPGRYALRVRHTRGERNGEFLMEHEQEVDVPASGATLRIPARFGGRVAAEVVCADGRVASGRCRVLGRLGPVTDWRPIDHRGHLLPEELLEAGDYELEADLGPDGVHRRPVTVVAREIADVVVRVP